MGNIDPLKWQIKDYQVIAIAGSIDSLALTGWARKANLWMIVSNIGSNWSDLSDSVYWILIVVDGGFPL